MEIRNSFDINTYSSFKGHEAKKLSTILVQKDKKFGAEAILQQLDSIASQYQVRVEPIRYFSGPWIQDEIYFTPNKKVISANYRYASGYADIYGLEPDTITSNTNNFRTKEIDGGNILFVTDKNGQQVILTARNKDGVCELEGYDNVLNPDKIIQLPRADFHADLFVTPIGDNKVLVANDKLMLDGLDRILEACVFFVTDNPNDESAKEIEEVSKKLLKVVEMFEESTKNYKFKGCDEESAKILQENGFEVITVPSRIYNFEKWNKENNTEDITHLLNYSNAITFKDRNGETVLVTGKSGLEQRIGLTDKIAKKIGIDFETLFKEAVSPHIKPENIHFILGDKKKPIASILEEFKGGLHCMCTEVPDYLC